MNYFNPRERNSVKFMAFEPFEGTTYPEWVDYHIRKGGTYEQIAKAMCDSEEKKTPGQRMLVINQLRKPKEY